MIEIIKTQGLPLQPYGQNRANKKDGGKEILLFLEEIKRTVQFSDLKFKHIYAYREDAGVKPKGIRQVC